MGLEQHFTTLGFLGAGNMAGAIIRAVVGKGLLAPSACIAADVIPGKLEELRGELGIGVAASPGELFDRARCVVLATKPQDLPKALAEVAGRVTPDHLLVSIAAGLTCARIEALLPAGTRVIRVMPNTPAMIGEGAAGVAAGSNPTKADMAAVVALFQSVGFAAEVGEPDLDAVTALSGSGPAYVFRFMELMQAAGEEMGLPPGLAARLTIQTFVGASKLAASSPEPPAELRRRVTSPGGTTAAALAAFEEDGLEKLIKRGLHRARERGIELAKG